MTGLLIISVVLLGYALVSGRLSGASVTAPIVFARLGLLRGDVRRSGRAGADALRVPVRRRSAGGSPVEPGPGAPLRRRPRGGSAVFTREWQGGGGARRQSVRAAEAMADAKVETSV